MRTKREIDENLKAFLHAYFNKTCLEVAKNIAFGNPGDKSHLPCAEAQRRLPCSSCEPTSDNPFLSPALLDNSIQPEHVVEKHKVFRPTFFAPPLIKEYREHATAWLNDFADKRWALKDTSGTIENCLPLQQDTSGDGVADQKFCCHQRKSVIDFPSFLCQRPSVLITSPERLV